MGTNTGTVMTLANGIIGVSVLAMPFCFKQCGIALSILMLLCSNFVSRLACHFLLKAAIMARRRNFEFLAFHIFGSTGKFTAELFIIGFLMGTCIAFFVVMGDLGPAIVAKGLGIDNTAALRPSVLIGLAVFVVLPLGLLRNVDSLATICTATIGFYGCLVLKVIGEAMPHLVAGDWVDKVHLWRPAGIMQCIPIFSMALFCQTQLFEIYESLHNASLERMNDVVRAAVNMCTGVYICVGFFGYVAYCTQTFSGNVMMSFTPSSLSEVIKVGFVLSVGVSFPLVIFPCRASLYSLLFRRQTGVPHHEAVSAHIPETRFKCLTVFIISMSLLVGLLIPNIELVLGLVGSTIGVLICIMFPAAAFIRISSKSSYERLLAQVVLFVGALILVLGTYATLYAANEIPAENTTTAKPEMNKLVVEQVKPKDDVVELPATAGVRQEPPVPVEPAPDLEVPPVPVVEKVKEIPSVEKVPPIQVVEKVNEVPALKKVNEIPVPEKVNDEVPVVKANELLAVQKVNEVPVVEKVKEIPAVEKVQPAAAQEWKEPVQKEESKLIDQDAIRKEDEELAEAEKEAKDESEKKDAELLRKLEAHEEEQIKLLREQKQILQALQEHKKEIERSQLKLQPEKSKVSHKKDDTAEQKAKVPTSNDTKVKAKQNAAPQSQGEQKKQEPMKETKVQDGGPEKVKEIPALEKVKEIPALKKVNKVPALEKVKEIPALEKVKEIPALEKVNEVPALMKVNEVPIVEKAELKAVEPANFLLQRLRNPTNVEKSKEIVQKPVLMEREKRDTDEESCASTATPDKTASDLKMNIRTQQQMAPLEDANLVQKDNSLPVQQATIPEERKREPKDIKIASHLEEHNEKMEENLQRAARLEEKKDVVQRDAKAVKITSRLTESEIQPQMQQVLEDRKDFIPRNPQDITISIRPVQSEIMGRNLPQAPAVEDEKNLVERNPKDIKITTSLTEPEIQPLRIGEKVQHPDTRNLVDKDIKIASRLTEPEIQLQRIGEGVQQTAALEDRRNVVERDPKDIKIGVRTAELDKQEKYPHQAAIVEDIKIATRLAEPEIPPLKLEDYLQPAGMLQEAKPMKRDLKSLTAQEEDKEE